jgi:hypothetical protein
MEEADDLQRGLHVSRPLDKNMSRNRRVRDIQLGGLRLGASY